MPVRANDICATELGDWTTRTTVGCRAAMMGRAVRGVLWSVRTSGWLAVMLRRLAMIATATSVVSHMVLTVT